MAQRKDGYLTKLKRKVGEVWKHQPDLGGLSLIELAEKSNELKSRAKRVKSLDILLPEAYAVVCEVAHRVLKIRPYDEQIMGAIALHEGMIIEMQNGEGKTLTATMPAYLNSLANQKVHIATHNTYLAGRDAKWMGPIYLTLGMSVGVIDTSQRDFQLMQDDTTMELNYCSRKDAYACDITYGVHTDFCMDYLRDNSVTMKEQIIQNGHRDYILLDEADSILIDLARTPLRIVKNRDCDANWYRALLNVAQQLQQDEDYILHPIELTNHGIVQAETLLKTIGLLSVDGHLYSTKNAGIADQLLQSISALHFYKVDRDYIVKDDTIIPINTYTGRLLIDHSLPDGIHQAVQARENLDITPEHVKLAEISYQHFFKLYKKMAGMTATAKERAQEFLDVYDKRVIDIPLHHQQFKREDLKDLIYRTSAGRLQGVLNEIEAVHSQGRPILINTLSVEKADNIGRMLINRNITCQVLHAKYYEKEAEIIKQAGRKDVVTVIAEMAGRGTDIFIGDDVAKLGGLHVIGVERHTSRHLDRQLIGRAGRQGKPGSSRFFLALDDELMRRFAADRVSKVMQMVGMDEDMPLESALVSRFIKQAQARLEGYNFEQRQRAYELDSVLDKQRQRIYGIRRKALLQEDFSEDIKIIVENIVMKSMEIYLKKKRQHEEWDIDGLATFFHQLSNRISPDSFVNLKQRNWNDIKDWLTRQISAAYNSQIKALLSIMTEEILMQLESHILIRHLDSAWQNHLYRLQQLQEEMVLRSQLEADQLEWYSLESYKAFWVMLEQAETGFLRDFLRNLHPTIIG